MKTGRTKFVSVYYNEGPTTGPLAVVEEYEDGYRIRSHSYRPSPRRVFALATAINFMGCKVRPFLTSFVGYVAEIHKEAQNV